MPETASAAWFRPFYHHCAPQSFSWFQSSFSMFTMMHSWSSLKLHHPHQEGICFAGARCRTAIETLHPSAQAGSSQRRPSTTLCDHRAGVLLHISITGWLPGLSDWTKAWSKFCIQAPRNVWHSSCWSAWKEGLFIYLLSKEKLPLGLKRLTLPLPSGWKSLNGTSQFYCSQYDIYKLPPDAFALTTVAMTVHCSKTQRNK